jgi:hypothetical protein
MNDLAKHWFGLPVPEGVQPVRAWGARAILRNEQIRKPVRRKGRVVGHDYSTKVTFELVPDRANYRGPDDDGMRAFFKWLNTDGLKALAKTIDEASLGLDEDRTLTVGRSGDGPSYTLNANPRKSYGYLYIVAWEV